MIRVLSTEVEEGWWKGVIADKVGMFPDNFVEVVEEKLPLKGVSIQYTKLAHKLVIFTTKIEGFITTIPSFNKL